MPEPLHHELYRRYWLEYRSAYGGAEREHLGRLMDEQQNKFGREEFFKFRETLPGFMEFWGTFRERMVREIKRNAAEKNEDH